MSEKLSDKFIKKFYEPEFSNWEQLLLKLINDAGSREGVCRIMITNVTKELWRRALINKQFHGAGEEYLIPLNRIGKSSLSTLIYYDQNLKMPKSVCEGFSTYLEEYLKDQGFLCSIDDKRVFLTIEEKYLVGAEKYSDIKKNDRLKKEEEEKKEIERLAAARKAKEERAKSQRKPIEKDRREEIFLQ